MIGERGSPKALDVIIGAHSDHPHILKAAFSSTDLPELAKSLKLLPGPEYPVELVAIYT